MLDNCEHVIDAAADLVEELPATSEIVTVLAISREGLALDGEQLIAVPGLDSSGDDAAAVAESSGPQVSRRTPGNSRRWCTNSGGHRSFWATDKHSPDHQRALDTSVQLVAM